MPLKKKLTDTDRALLVRIVKRWEKDGPRRKRKPAELLAWFTDATGRERQSQSVKLGLLLASAARIGCALDGWVVHQSADREKSGNWYTLRRPGEIDPATLKRERKAKELADEMERQRRSNAGPPRRSTLALKADLIASELLPLEGEGTEAFRELVYEVRGDEHGANWKRRWRFVVKLPESTALDFVKCRSVVLSDLEGRILDLLEAEAAKRGESLDPGRVAVDLDRALPRGSREGNT